MRPPDKIDATARGDSYGRQLNQALHYCASFGCDPAVVEGLQHEYQPFQLRDPELGQEQAYLMAVASGPEMVTGLISFGISFINPFEIRFSQDSINYRFRRPFQHQTIDDLAQLLKSGQINPEELPPIRVVEMDGKMFTLDNRRLEAFRRAGIDVPYVFVDISDPQIAKEFQRKYTTLNEGLTITVRGQ